MRKIFYGWYVAIACGLGLACGLASVITATFSIFLGPLRAEFGWTPSQTFTGLLLVTALVAQVAVEEAQHGCLLERLLSCRRALRAQKRRR